jgi:hypothetical protein
MPKSVRVPKGADPKTYRPGIKKERQEDQQSQLRHHIAKRAAMTSEERQINSDYTRAADEAHFQRRRDEDSMPMAEAQANYDRTLQRLREERDGKLAALPPEKRSDGTYDVTTFDFEAHERSQREAWEAKVNAMFPPAKNKGDTDNASRS